MKTEKALYGAEYYSKNRDRILARSAAYYKANRGVRDERSTKWRLAHPESHMLRTARRRARVKGIPFNLVASDIRIPTHCPVLGIPLVPNQGAAKANSPSLDRLDPSKGYVKGNVHVISHRANAIKSDANQDEIAKVLRWIVDASAMYRDCQEKQSALAEAVK